MPTSSKPALTLKQRVLQSGSWSLAGYGVNQALRLGGNLILTRLLFPEAFGLMAVVQAVIFGVHMLTDMGIGPSIIQKNQGNDPVFLNTAWTVQIARGVLVWGGLCALALPLAKLYGEPLLAGMIPVVGLSAIIQGFNSTKLYSAQRNLAVARVAQIDVAASSIGLLVTVYLAWLQRSVWALVWGHVITTSLKMFASHLLLRGIRNQFAWDRGALDHLIGFGRWILLSSGLTFLSLEGARLVIGALLDMRQLALFTLASTMNLVFWQAMQQLAWGVFFPAYSEAYRSNPKNFMAVLFKSRLLLILPSLSLSVLFIFFGSQVMEILYDERYHGSGLMLEQLAAGLLAACVWGSYAGVLMALGKVATSTLLTAIQVVCQFSVMFIGYRLGGGSGLVMGVAAANWVVYPLYACVMFRNGLWQPKLDLILLAVSVLVVVQAWPALTRI
ncbi:MAG: oligosaccharide flippase family protein [Nitrosomonadales bacterium]|nr:oligosaccharide flippase family protein [Nitrosomonadales bacterium]